MTIAFTALVTLHVGTSAAIFPPVTFHPIVLIGRAPSPAPSSPWQATWKDQPAFGSLSLATNVSSFSELEDQMEWDFCMAVNCSKELLITSAELVFSQQLNLTDVFDLSIQSRIGTILSGEDATRLFYLQNDSRLSLRGVHLARGRCQGGWGGAIFVSPGGVLTLRSVSVSTSRAHCGGAIFANSARVIVHDSTLTSNSAVYGGALAASSSVVKMTSCDISSNAAVRGGGALHAHGSSAVSMSGGVMTSNSARNGGAIMVSNAAFLGTTGLTMTANSARFCGGAVSARDAAAVTIATSTMTFNSAVAGGAVAGAGGSNLTAIDCTIASNSAQVWGGAVRIVDRSSVTVLGSTLTSNSAMWGGVLDAEGDSLIYAAGCTMTSNSAANSGGVIQANNHSTVTLLGSLMTYNTVAHLGGGAVAVEGDSSIATADCTFASNSASLGGVFYALDTAEVLVSDCVMVRNVATFGGVLFAGGESVILAADSLMSGNVAKSSGGVVSADNGSPVVVATNCEMTWNSAYFAGGAVDMPSLAILIATDSVIESNWALYYGGGIFAQSYSSVSATSSTFTSNRVAVDGIGGAVHVTDCASFAAVDSAMSRNYASFAGAALAAMIYSSLITTGCTLTSNTAAAGGSLFSTGASTATMANSTMASNYASHKGGAIWTSADSVLLVSYSTLSGNSAQATGGAVMHSQNSIVTIEQSTITDNFASRGGAVNGDSTTTELSGSLLLVDCQLVRNSAISGGALLVGNESHTDVRSSRFEYNRATEGSGAVFVQDGGTVNLVDSVFSFNGVGGGDIVGISVDSGGHVLCDRASCYVVCSVCDAQGRNSTLQNKMAAPIGDNTFHDVVLLATLAAIGVCCFGMWSAPESRRIRRSLADHRLVRCDSMEITLVEAREVTPRSEETLVADSKLPGQYEWMRPEQHPQAVLERMGPATAASLFGGLVPATEVEMSLSRPHDPIATARSRSGWGRLPEDVVQSVLGHLAATDLRQAAATRALWRELVPLVAERRLRLYRPNTAPGSRASPCWLRSLSTVELLRATIGPRPTSRAWRDEYVPLQLAVGRLNHSWTEEHVEMMRPEFTPGGSHSVESDSFRSSWEPLHQTGWPVEEAQVVHAVAGVGGSRAINNAILVRSDEFAAITHALLEAYSNAALREATGVLTSRRVMQPRYAPLHGNQSLVAHDATWHRLDQMDIGASTLVVSPGFARAPLACYFPDDRGMYTEHMSSTIDDNGEVEWKKQFQLNDSNVVCFLSRAPDRSGFHALVHDGIADSNYNDCWSVAPFATITLVAVSAPGEWSVHGGLRPRRWLFTVRASFG